MSHHGTVNGGGRDSWVIACGESGGGSKIDGDDDHDADDDNDRCDDNEGGVGILEVGV